MKFTINGPDGKSYSVEADTEEAAQAAVDSLYPGRAPRDDNNKAIVELLQRLVYPTVPKPTREYGPEMLAALKRIEEKEFPVPPEPIQPEKIDFTPLIKAIERVEAKEYPKPADPVDLTPLANVLVDKLGAKIDALGKKISRLATAVGETDSDNTVRHTAVLSALEHIDQVMSAPRRLVRENGVPVASVVDLNGEFSATED